MTFFKVFAAGSTAASLVCFEAMTQNLKKSPTNLSISWLILGSDDTTGLRILNLRFLCLWLCFECRILGTLSDTVLLFTVLGFEEALDNKRLLALPGSLKIILSELKATREVNCLARQHSTSTQSLTGSYYVGKLLYMRQMCCRLHSVYVLLYNMPSISFSQFY